MLKYFQRGMKYNLQVSLFGSYCTELVKSRKERHFMFCSLYRTALCEFLGLKLTGSLKKINYCLAGSSSSLPDERKQIEVARRKEDEKTE